MIYYAKALKSQLIQCVLRLTDTEEKKPIAEDDDFSEMEDELPICCFAFDLICCPQRYWNISKRPDQVGDSQEKKVEGEMAEEKDKK